MDYPLEHTIDKARSASSRTRAIFRSFCLAFGLETVFIITYILFPYVPEDGGDDSPVGRCVLFLHFPMFWVAGRVSHLVGIAQFAVSALLSVAVWTVLFYAAERGWRALR